MDNIKLYEVVPRYIDYLSPHARHLFHNKQAGQQNERKYIGIVLTVNGMDYFAPLSSFKEKHRRMQESLDFIKVKNYAVINLNNMFPVPAGQYSYVDISKVRDSRYRSLLQSEYRRSGAMILRHWKSCASNIAEQRIVRSMHNNRRAGTLTYRKGANSLTIICCPF